MKVTNAIKKPRCSGERQRVLRIARSHPAAPLLDGEAP
jgi:hypothetical protein